MDDTRESKKEKAEDKALQAPEAAASTEASERLLASSRTEKASSLPTTGQTETRSIISLSNLSDKQNPFLNLFKKPASSSTESGSHETKVSGDKGMLGLPESRSSGKSGLEFAGFTGSQQAKDQSRITQDRDAGSTSGSKDQARLGQDSGGGSAKDLARIPQSDFSGFGSKNSQDSLPNTTIVEKRVTAAVPIHGDDTYPYGNMGSKGTENSVNRTMKSDRADAGSDTSYQINRANKSDSQNLLEQLKTYNGPVGACNTEEAKQMQAAYASSTAMKTDSAYTKFVSAESANNQLNQMAEAYKTANPVNTDYHVKAGELMRDYNTTIIPKTNMDSFSRDPGVRANVEAMKDFAAAGSGKEINAINSMNPVGRPNDWSTNSIKDFSPRDFGAKDYSVKDFGGKELSMGGKDIGVARDFAAGSGSIAKDPIRSGEAGGSGSQVRDFAGGKEDFASRLGGVNENRISSAQGETREQRSNNGDSAAGTRSNSNSVTEPSRFDSSNSRSGQPDSSTQSSRTLPDVPQRSSSTDNSNSDTDRKSRTIDVPQQQSSNSQVPQTDRISQSSPTPVKADAVASLARQSTGAEQETALLSAKGLASIIGLSGDKAALPPGGQSTVSSIERGTSIAPLTDRSGNPFAINSTNGERGLSVSAQSAGLIPAAERGTTGNNSALTPAERVAQSAAQNAAGERGLVSNNANTVFGQDKVMDASGKLVARAEDVALSQIGRKDAGLVAPINADRLAQPGDNINAGNKAHTSIDPLTGNIRINADAIAAGKGDALVGGKLVGAEKIGELALDANGKVQVTRTADGQIVVGKADASTGGKTQEFMLVDGEAVEVDENGVPFRRIHSKFGEKRYLTGVELTIAAVIAMSGAAKVREGFLADSEANKGNGEEDGSKVLHRRTHLVAQGETLQSIAEAMYQNPDVAWLIADLNATNLKEDIIDGRRVVELKTRQLLELPEPEEVTQFLTNLRKDFQIEQLITVVSETTIDRELLNSFLGTVTGGAPATASSAIAARTEEAPIALPELSIELGNPEDLPVGQGIASLVRDLGSRVGRMVKRPAGKLRTV